MKPILISCLIALYATFSCKSRTEEMLDIRGFWECYMPADSERMLHFCEITDSVFAFWNEEVSYLPPYLYSVSTVDSLFFEGVQGQSDIATNKQFVGVISIIDSVEFQVISENDTIHFIKSSKEKFKKSNMHKEKWLDF